MGRGKTDGALLEEDVTGSRPAHLASETSRTLTCNHCQNVWTPAADEQEFSKFGLCYSCFLQMQSEADRLQVKEPDYPYKVHDSSANGRQDFLGLSSSGPTEHPPSPLLTDEKFKRRFLNIIQDRIASGEDIWAEEFEHVMVSALHQTQVENQLLDDFPAGTERERLHGLAPSLAWKDGHDQNPGADIYALSRSPESPELQHILRMSQKEGGEVLGWYEGEPVMYSHFDDTEGGHISLSEYLVKHGASEEKAERLVKELQESCTAVQCKSRRSRPAVTDYDRVQIDLMHGKGGGKEEGEAIVKRHEDGLSLRTQRAIARLQEAEEKLTRFSSVASLQALAIGNDNEIVVRLAESPSAVLSDFCARNREALEKRRQVSRKAVFAPRGQAEKFAPYHKAQMYKHSVRLSEFDQYDSNLVAGEIKIAANGELSITTGLDSAHIIMDATVQAPAQASLRRNLAFASEEAHRWAKDSAGILAEQDQRRFVRLPEEKQSEPENDL